MTSSLKSGATETPTPPSTATVWREWWRTSSNVSENRAPSSSIEETGQRRPADHVPRRLKPDARHLLMTDVSVKSICGAILVSARPELLAELYGAALGLSLEREEHGGHAPHWGIDIGRIHFGIHPPENFQKQESGNASVVLAFDVTSLKECQARLERLGTPCFQVPHDEGFGVVASFTDPESQKRCQKRCQEGVRKVSG